VNRVFLFAHFDAQCEVRPHVEAHLRALKELGGSIRFVSNSALPEVELSKVRAYADGILLRENRGMDFSMWKAAIDALDLSGVDELVLTNSSVAGPNRPLEPIFQRMEADPCDFWGMTESWEISHHIQSYFIVFRRPVLQSVAFKHFWGSVLPYQSKICIVYSYELGLSVFLKENGYVGAVAFPLDVNDNGFIHNVVCRGNLVSRIHFSRNPTLYYPDLLVRAGMPYLKLLLFHTNPYGIRLGPLRDLARRQGYDLGFLDSTSRKDT